MSYTISDTSSSYVNFAGTRTRYQYDSYFDGVDTSISQLITIPPISNFRIEAAKDFGGTGTGWSQILDSKGLSHFAKEDAPAGSIAREISAYVPDGNPTDFAYGYALDEHALFFVKTITPNRELIKFKWEVNGQLTQEGPFLTLFNLQDTQEDVQLVTCIAEDPRGRQERITAKYICNPGILSSEITGTNYRNSGLGFLVPDFAVFQDTTLPEDTRQKPFYRVDTGESSDTRDGLTFSEWKAAISNRDLIKFKNAGIDENQYGEPEALLDASGNLAGAFKEIYDNGWLRGAGGGKENPTKRMPGYMNNEHRVNYPSEASWLLAVFLKELAPIWNKKIGFDRPDFEPFGIEIDWKD